MAIRLDALAFRDVLDLDAPATEHGQRADIDEFIPSLAKSTRCQSITKR
jgi:hypothetical protein